MNNGRLQVVKQQNARLRKRLMLKNDRAKFQLQQQNAGIVREATIFDNKREALLKPLLTKLIDLKGYKSTLNKRRTSVSVEENNVYVTYGGVTYRDLKSAVRTEINQQHPRVKKLNRAKAFLKDSQEDGRIVNPKETLEKLGSTLNKPFPKFEWKDPKESDYKRGATMRLILPPIKAQKGNISGDFTPRSTQSDLKSKTSLLQMNRSSTII